MAKFALNNSLNRMLYILKFLSIYPSPEQKTYVTVTRRIVIYGFFICPFVFNLLAKMVQSCNDLAAFVSVSYIAGLSFMAVLKSFYLMYHQDRLVAACNGIQANRPKMNETQNELITDYMQWWRKYHFIIGIVVPLTCLPFWNAMPLLGSQELRLPFLTWYPYDINGTMPFTLTYLHQTVSISLISCVNMNVDCLMGGLMAYTAGECMVLEDCLENMVEMTKFYFEVKDEQARGRLSETLGKLVVFHREIRR